jgi:dipeptidyl aminopeptidase/acylaminoacyl peptidase
LRAAPGEAPRELTPAPFSARTTVHEYGGGAFTVAAGAVYASSFADQRVYRVGDGEPRAITPEGRWRWADGAYDARRARLVFVREEHGGAAVENALVAVDPSGARAPAVLASGADFYSTPRPSPDGARLAWLEWRHPHMPWVSTELWVAPFADDGTLGAATRVAGGPDESIVQPEWSPDGTLCFISDRSGWWNLYRSKNDQIESLWPIEAELAQPQWVFGMSSYAFAANDELVCAYSQNGFWRLASLSLLTGKAEPIETLFTDISLVRARGGRVVFRGGASGEPTCIARLDLRTLDGAASVLARSTTLDDSVRPYLTIPESIEFPTENGLTAHGLYYPPHNPDFQAPQNEKPPLLVKSHGGPTAAASTALDLRIHYWTSRGFAVLDVNYGGSSGYGRAYRHRLERKWGIVDLDDCVNGARHLARTGRADEARLAISGGSAGGYTTLCALTFRDVFKTGASSYGVCDLEVLARDTHKFESRYLDWLIGPYPADRPIYVERSPIHFTDKISVPIIFFQGEDDKVVPPNQTELMVEALKRKNLPFGYFLFAGEQHGFRQAANIKRALDGELYFYAVHLLGTGLRF